MMFTSQKHWPNITSSITAFNFYMSDYHTVKKPTILTLSMWNTAHQQIHLVFLSSCLNGSLPVCSLRGKPGSPLSMRSSECQDKLGLLQAKKCLMSSSEEQINVYGEQPLNIADLPFLVCCVWLSHENTALLPRRFPPSWLNEWGLCLCARLQVKSFHHPLLCIHFLALITSHQTP